MFTKPHFKQGDIIIDIDYNEYRYVILEYNKETLSYLIFSISKRANPIYMIKSFLERYHCLFTKFKQ